MKPKRRRLYYVLFGMAALGLAVALVLSAFSDSLVFFYSPTDIATRDVEPGRRLRLGGLVEEGSVSRDGSTVNFIVTDLTQTIQVSFTGILPDLFREGQGVVTEGSLQADGRFLATNVLAKHDETYLPKEVADALKASGRWRDNNDNAQALTQ